ncbi:MAG: DotA/TraY family protein [Micavibrio sp.]|nr:DotA/TraY family protein [Micavibrio sp.]
MQAKRKDIFFYILFPQILPRLRDLIMSGFQFIPYMIAYVYAAVKLLPVGHPFLNGKNIGRYSLRDVVFEAGRQLNWNIRNIDQILIFLMVIVGLILMIMQIGLLAVSLFIGPVFAAAGGFPTSFADFFVTANPDQDLAYIMLDLVFGVPDMFNSCVFAGGCVDSDNNAVGALIAQQNGITAVHAGLHALFRVYSLGLLVIAAMIFSYMVATVIAETMQSGMPFGRRYNHVWAPIRMVVAFGLLIPISLGLNTSQYLVLYAAKFGSSFATNGWVYFYNNLENGMISSIGSGQQQDMVAVPNAPQMGSLLQFLYTARACAFAEDMREGHDEKNRPEVKPWIVLHPENAVKALEISTVPIDYNQIMNAIEGDAGVTVRFGRWDNDNNRAGSTANAGLVEPVCGELYIPLTDPRPAADQADAMRAVQEFYISIIPAIWMDADPDVNAEAFILSYAYVHNFVNDQARNYTYGEPTNAQSRSQKNIWNGAIAALISNPGSSAYASAPYVQTGLPAGGVVQAMYESDDFQIALAYLEKGWAGAAIWYNKIAELNGMIGDTVANKPNIKSYPRIMAEVSQIKAKGKGSVSVGNQFDPTGIDLGEPFDNLVAQALYATYNFWSQSGSLQSAHNQNSGNAFKDLINMMFGTDGLFSMRDPQNANVHPLALLSVLGRGLISASINNLASAGFVAGVGEFANMSGVNISGAAGSIASALVKFSMVGLTAGFVLYYVIPFLPFIYFMFAFSGWVKGIFEAMVGAPLWALAHIRIDGHGLPGQAAVTGYLLIFEIFLRPILMVFGLLASISIFSALVFVLNLVFDLVVSNVGGYDVEAGIANAGAAGGMEGFRDVVDQLFFTVIYTVIVYMLGMSSFKLIDLIPNNILRWLGHAVSTFNDSQENAAEAMVGKVSQGSQQTFSAIGGGLGKLVNPRGG